VAPLTGIKVVELGVMIAVPGASGTLAGLGASVIKVEDTERGDELRNYGSTRNGMSGWFANTNAGKRSISVDLNTPHGKEILWKLMEDADVFIQGFRAGALSKLGFDFKTVSEKHPALVYCSSTGFGESGPYADQPAYDPVIQSLSGWAGFQSVNGQPTLHKAMVSDKTAAVYNVQAILAALVQRGRTGKGCFIEASMLESNIMFNWPDVMMQCTLLEEDANHTPNIFNSYRLYECTDGHATIACGNDKQWQAFCKALEAENLLSDSRFLTAKVRATHIPEFFEVIAEVACGFTVATLVSRLQAADVPVAPVHLPEAVKDDPQVVAREFIEEKQHPRVGRFLGAKSPISMFGEEIILSPAPMLGEQTAEVLIELGYDQPTIDSLKIEGVINCFE
jgi:crotonobetainyl-CoA:carnitine CoA-transferase CaiB-like acyl-CoA transferase